VKIPQERVSILIGADGKTKKKIENRTNCRIEVSDGEVSIEGESLDEWVAKDIIFAIGRGFNPEKALQLNREGHVFESIDITEYANTPQSRERLKGRVIGQAGRTRKHIEKSTGAMISVYGKTASLIGPYDGVEAAKEAITRLLSGSRHGTVYRMLEKRCQSMGKSPADF
jgi:ribosomal RNA assembly protein